MSSFGIRLGKVVAVNYAANTVDCLLESGGGMIYGAFVATPMATTNSGYSELPVLKTVAHKKMADSYVIGRGAAKNNDNLYHAENVTVDKTDLEDAESQYVYAILGMFDEKLGKNSCVVLGFVYPFRNQMLFDPEKVDTTNPKLDAVVKKAIKKMKGGLLHRTNSGVYWTVDLDGNTEWAHPNGSFLRMGEFPTKEEDGAYHIDLTGGNRKAEGTKGSYPNMRYDTLKNKGVDGKVNNSRKLNLHLEIVTQKGVVELDINKKNGDITIKTPQNLSDSKQDSNRLTIIAGGDATIQSVEGNIKVHSVKQNVNIEAAKDVDIRTTNKGTPSILLGANAKDGFDILPLFNKLMKKFNAHNHKCQGTGHDTSGPKPTLDLNDATKIVKAG